MKRQESRPKIEPADLEAAAVLDPQLNDVADVWLKLETMENAKKYLQEGIDRLRDEIARAKFGGTMKAFDEATDLMEENKKPEAGLESNCSSHYRDLVEVVEGRKRKVQEVEEALQKLKAEPMECSKRAILDSFPFLLPAALLFTMFALSSIYKRVCPPLASKLDGLF
ncbi:unnamed protein product [Linum trigynum]|uniref:Uncharacterized protein n=1 Tax=Linum trigynum TaxID=586398 RepID=A0AAV2CNI8_9ROSI